MAAELALSCYEGNIVQSFKVYGEYSKQYKVIPQYLHNILAEEFKRIGAGTSSMDVLGVGSGGGEMDIKLLDFLQSAVPTVTITADIVEGSSKLTEDFKALVAKTSNLQEIPFAWHIMKSETYEKQVKATGDMKKFDFIHMIHVVYYMDNVADTIKFYHSLLKKNGRLMIVVASDTSGWNILWKAYHKELSVSSTKWCSAGEVTAFLKSQGLKYEEHIIPNSFDISLCFNPNSKTGEQLLNFFTMGDNFYQSFTPEIRAGMLDLLRKKCSTEKDGKILFNINASCILVHA